MRTPLDTMDLVALAVGGAILITQAALLRYCPPNGFGNSLRRYFAHGLFSEKVTSVGFLVGGLLSIGISIYVALTR